MIVYQLLKLIYILNVLLSKIADQQRNDGQRNYYVDYKVNDSELNLCKNLLNGLINMTCYYVLNMIK